MAGIAPPMAKFTLAQVRQDGSQQTSACKAGIRRMSAYPLHYLSGADGKNAMTPGGRVGEAGEDSLVPGAGPGSEKGLSWVEQLSEHMQSAPRSSTHLL